MMKRMRFFLWAVFPTHKKESNLFSRSEKARKAELFSAFLAFFTIETMLVVEW